MRVAIQGERGSFSHQAARLLVPSATEIRSCALSAQVFDELSRGDADLAVIPIENSLAGSVLEHYDLLLAHPVTIEAEMLLRIRHHLIVAPGMPLGAVREVYSHPVALAQCRSFFADHPELRAMPFYDTAGAAAHAVAQGRESGFASIAGEQAAAEYGGKVLLAGIEDNQANYTRFLLVRSEAFALRAGTGAGEAPRQANKVSLAFAVPNQPGALVAALEIFARHRLNLTRLESRPVPGSPWQYVFYTDYQIESDTAAESALEELAGRCSFLKELGRYAAAALPEAGL